MKSNIVKPFFFIFLFLVFLAGWYFYVMNPTSHYIEYMDNMNVTNDVKEEVEKQLQEELEKQLQEELEKQLQEEPQKIQSTVKDASRENSPYNSNMYAGFDPTSQYVGVYTNLDQIHQSTSFSELSDNPMDSNWGGVLYTKQAVDSGKYAENVIVPYGYDPVRGVGISTSINSGNGDDVKSVFA